MALIHSIESLLDNANSGEALPINFYFADDTIISGETFHKANSFLLSLIPSRHKNLFPTTLIKKCFVLVDRLSIESKRSYVANVQKDFYSFLHIDLSNMRIQGDSCVCCKLLESAGKLLAHSATKSIEHYWVDKMDKYRAVGFNTLATHSDEKENYLAFQKLVLSHLSQNVIFINNDYFNPGAIYDSLLDIISTIFFNETNGSTHIGHQILLTELRKGDRVELLKNFLKIVSRPFFSYDFKAKLQVLTLQLILSEFLLNESSVEKEIYSLNDPKKSQYPYKKFLFLGNRVERSLSLFRRIREQYLNTKEKVIDFLQDCLMVNFAEMQSTYMLRRSTMVSIFRFMLEPDAEGNLIEHGKAPRFWEIYAALVHQIIDCSSDEMYSVWLEYLLISGMEHREFHKTVVDSFSPVKLSDVLSAGVVVKEKRALIHFCDELLLQNCRAGVDSLMIPVEECINDGGTAISFGGWRRYRCIDKFQSDKNYANEIPLCEERTLHELLTSGSQQFNNNPDVKKHYDELLEAIAQVAEKKYNFQKTDIGLLTLFPDASTDCPPKLNQLDFVSSRIFSAKDSYLNKYKIKEKLVNNLSTIEGDITPPLRKYGYVVHNEDSNGYLYFFVSFETFISEYTIVPVYLYFGFPAKVPNSEEHYLIMLFLRDILSYRSRLLKTLRNDFSGDIFPKYAHTAGEKSVLAHEKASSHNTTGDDRAVLGLFVDRASVNNYKNLDSSLIYKWLLFHNHNNSQIAKLFNRSYQSSFGYDHANNYITSTQLYLKSVDMERLVYMFSPAELEIPLTSFRDLRWNDDIRYSMLDTVAEVNYAPLVDCEFLCNPKREYYNAELFKVILFDIVFSAIKSGTVATSFLERIDNYLSAVKERNLNRIKEKSEINKESGKCKVEISIMSPAQIDGEEEEKFDYLVIRNPVVSWQNNIFDWQAQNEIIDSRIKNPIDYSDGHMSLLTISKYIEGLWPEELEGKTIFHYITIEDSDNQVSLYFESMLPILKHIPKKEDLNE